MSNYNRSKIQEDIMGYCESGKHIVDSKYLKPIDDVAKDVTKLVLTRDFNFDKQDLEKADNHQTKIIPERKKSNFKLKLKLAALPAGILLASAGVNFILTKYFPEQIAQHGQWLSRGTWFAGGAALTTAMFNTKKYFVNRTPFYKKEEKNELIAKDTFQEVQGNFAELRAKKHVKKYGYL